MTCHSYRKLHAMRFPYPCLRARKLALGDIAKRQITAHDSVCRENSHLQANIEGLVPIES